MILHSNFSTYIAYCCKLRPEDDLAADLGDFHQDWIDVCQGGNPSDASFNFEYRANMIEDTCLGFAAYHTGTELEYYGEKGLVTNNADAGQYSTKPYHHKGWDH